MAMQGIWSGTIGFSLVAIPVRLVTAVESGRVSFRLLHRSDYAPLARKLICPEDGSTVPRDAIIKGYEIGPDVYIPLTNEELESVSPERSRTIEIVEFVDLKEVDPIFFDHPYYLVPGKGGEKAYRLLVEVMRRTHTAGIAKFVLAEREYLVAVRCADGAMQLTTLHYSDEIRSAGDFTAGDNDDRTKEESQEERQMKKTIRSMLLDFEPAKYADRRRMEIRELLTEKAKAQALVEAPPISEEEEEGPPDLVAALEESMRKVKAGR